MSKVTFQGIDKDISPDEFKCKVEELFLTVNNDCSWLQRGDRVLLKPALNSPHPYPSTSDPVTLHIIADLLIQKGAEVIVGDQSGIGYVLQDASGKKYGSTITNFYKSGMSKGSKLKFIAFEDRKWDEGFYNFKTERTQSWEDGFFVTKWIQEVDHIISLPRLSTHAQSGVTLGFKNMVGVLREDSRIQFHANGPYASFIRKLAKGSLLKMEDDKRDSFFEKIVEISLTLHDKLRCTFFTGTKAQTTFGPDRHVSVGDQGLLPAHIISPETGLLIASSDQIAAEIGALSFLTYLYKQTPWQHKSLHKLMIWINGQAKELGKQSVVENPFIKHALSLGIGDPNISATYNDVPNDIQEFIQKMIVI
ncbi:DUF362 domain-containing protein [Patescibacteria group bacterium]|nr:DUF362 domain-containing protein [Patescibacteria group bacterium]